MSDELLKKIEGVFGNNKYYVAIVNEFIDSFPKENTRIVINNDNINMKIKDLSGIKNVSFSLQDNYLKIKVDKTIDFRKYQDIITYDNYGVMLERTRSASIIKPNVNEEFRGKPQDLNQELDIVGENLTSKTGLVFDSIDYRKVKRPDNFGLDGLYVHKRIHYDQFGKLDGSELQGTFKVLDSNSISTLEIPDENEVLVVKQQILNGNQEDINDTKKM